MTVDIHLNEEDNWLWMAYTKLLLYQENTWLSKNQSISLEMTKPKTVCWPIPPVHQFENIILLIWIVQEGQNTIVEFFRVSGSVSPSEDQGGQQCKTELLDAIKWPVISGGKVEQSHC